MFVHNTSVSVEKCMEELAEWLKQFQKPLLVCHNGRAFDYYFIEKLYENFLLLAIGRFCWQFFFKEAIPSRKCYKLQALVKGYMSIIWCPLSSWRCWDFTVISFAFVNELRSFFKTKFYCRFCNIFYSV